MRKFLLLLVLLFLLSGCQQQVYTKTFFSMDTYITVKVYDQKDEPYLEEVKNIFDRYHKLSSMYEDGQNNVYDINENLKVNEEMTIDQDLADLIAFSLSWYEKTEGIFDPCIGGVTQIWHRYRNGELEGVPKLQDLKKERTSCSAIVIKANKIKKLGNVKLDLGGVAKGYATEKAGQYFKEHGVTKYLISAGGNVQVGAYYQDSGTYTVGLQSPIMKDQVFKVLHVEGQSVVTSGSYERYYEYDGKRYSHIIDPNTLFPASYMKSVTVITPSSADADVLSTYLFLLPVEEGKKYVEKEKGIEAIWFLNDNTILTSSGVNVYE